MTGKRQKLTWCERIANLLEAEEPETDASWGIFHVGGDHKPFVLNAMKELLSATFAAAKFKKGFVFTPHRIGAIVGTRWALQRSLGRDLILSQKLASKSPEFTALVDLLKLAEEEFPRDLVRARQTVLKAFRIALDQSAQEVGQFLDGFKQGLTLGVFTPEGGLAGSGSRTQLCFLVLVFGNELDVKFKTVSEFHDFATRTLGRNTAGDLERFQKFCQSIQLTFAKRGRPKKSETQKKPSS